MRKQHALKLKKKLRYAEHRARKTQGRIQSNCIGRAKFALWLKESGTGLCCPPRRAHGSRLTAIRIWRMRHTTNKLYEFGFALVGLGTFGIGTGDFFGGGN